MENTILENEREAPFRITDKDHPLKFFRNERTDEASFEQLIIKKDNSASEAKTTEQSIKTDFLVLPFK
jgi:hypothetical protein